MASRITSTAGITLLILTSFPLLSATAADPLPTSNDTYEMVVTAGRVSEPKQHVSHHLNVLDRETIRLSPARNVADLLVDQGLATIHKYPGNLTAVGMRGFQTDTHGNDLQGHLLVLLNGRRAGTGNLAKILTRHVEKIEIIRGAGAVQYGSAGMGGVINIITREGKENTLFVEVGGGSFGEQEISLGGSAVQGDFDFSGVVSRQRIGDYETGNGRTYHNTGIGRQDSLSLHAGYDLHPAHRFGLTVNYFAAEEVGSPGYLSRNDHDDYTDKNNYSLDFRYEGHDQEERYQWLARYFFGQDENQWFDPTTFDPDGWDNGQPSENKTDQQGGQLQFTTRLEMTTLTLGMDWLDYQVENSWHPKKTNYENPALFALLKHRFFNEQVVLDLGLRHDWYQVEVEEPVGRDEAEQQLTPKIGLVWLPNAAWKVRLQYAQGFMMATANQLAADYVSFGRRIQGNAALEPEKSHTYEIGVDFRQQAFLASFTYFQTDFTDKIVYGTLANGTQSWQNLGDAEIAGIELEASYDWGARFDWEWEVRSALNMTLLTRYKDRTNNTDLHNVSGLNYALGLTLSDWERFSTRFSLNYTGSQRVEDWESGQYPVPIETLESSLTANLMVSWRFYEHQQLGSWQLRGEWRNMLDEDYARVKGYPLPGQNFFASLRWEF